MKITLVGTYASPEASGLRLISSFLKSKGHQVQMILMTEKRSLKSKTSYDRELVEQFLSNVADSGLIGMSLMTNTYFQARDLTLAIKANGIKAPVVWGGVHPTVNPESCVDFADAVCVGEGEGPMADMAERIEKGDDFSQVPNLWLCRNGQVIKNEVRPLWEDLDALPFADYDISDHQFLVHKGKLVAATPKNMRTALKRYRLISTRGCPYNCAFCCNSSWLDLYRGKGRWVRKRSINHVIAELEAIKQRFPSVDSMSIADDTFFVRDETEFEEFADAYGKRIGWPFEINTHPSTINRRKIEILKSCGCKMIKMGIQTGCQETNYTVFNRRVPNETTIRAIGILNEFPDLRKEYHYIVGNPFESEQSRQETVRFIANHHGGNCRILIFPLALFPGSQLHTRAKAQGLIQDEQHEIYERVYSGKAKRRFDRLGYHTMLMKTMAELRQKGLSAKSATKITDALLAAPTRFFLDRAWFKLTAVGVYLLGRTVHKTVYQAFIRPFGKHRRKYQAQDLFVSEAG